MALKMAETVFLSCIILTFFIVIFSDDALESGKAQYEMIKKEIAGGSPKYTECWLNAMKNLHSGCKAITDDMQHRLSLQFANCFLAKNGRQTYQCAGDVEFDVCTKNMAPEAFGVYTGFFTHTQNMCYFLQAQVWQEQTDSTIHRLEQSSEDVAIHLEQSNARQQQLLSMQNESIKMQESIMAHSNQLMETVATSAVSVRSMTNDFMEVLYEQKSLIFGVFEKLSSLQSIVLGEVTGFYSFIFYLCSILLCYLLTSTQRTQGARFWLFVIMTSNVFAERLLVTLTANTDTSLDSNGKPIDNTEMVYWRLWQCRKVFVFIALVVYVWCACKYRDLNLINNQMLAQIQKQNEEIQRMLQAAEASQQQRLWPTSDERHSRRAAKVSSSIEKEAVEDGTSSNSSGQSRRAQDDQVAVQPSPLPPPSDVVSPSTLPRFVRPVGVRGGSSIALLLTDLTPTPSTSPDDGSERSVTPAQRRRGRRPRNNMNDTTSVHSDVSPDTPGSGRYYLRSRKPSQSPASPGDLNISIQRAGAQSGRHLMRAMASASCRQ